MIQSKGKKAPTNASKAPLRISLKCSWSGLRIQASETLTASSTLAQVIDSVSCQLPDLFSSNNSSEAQPALLYLRTTVWKHDWHSTTVAQILGDNVSGSVLFTLNLPGITAPASLSSADIVRSNHTEHTLRMNSEPLSSKVPMDIDNNESIASNEATKNPYPSSSVQHEVPGIHTAMSPKDALHKLLQHNFDVASKECLLTVLKIVDNVISKPDDPKVRSIRLSNPAIHDKIRSKTGGLDILFSIGFTMEQSFSTDLDPKITLAPEDENGSILLYTRQLIEQVLVNALGVSLDDLPPLRQPPRESSLARPVPHPTHAYHFDPFKPFTFNVQSAAAGAPDPTSIAPDGVVGPSLTEQRLDQLKKKQMKIEQELWTLKDRNLMAYHPSQHTKDTIVTFSAKDESDATFIGSSKGDASLIAGRLRRLEDERKKREEGGFTTSAMREMDKLIHCKIYSHTQVRIDFPDGSWVSCKFLPHEPISIVKDTLRSAFVTELFGVQFDLYVTPPRRLLMDRNTLTDEGLVPAAKIRLAWKDSDACVLASFIRPEFFCDTKGVDLSYPDAVPIVETNHTAKAISSGDDARIESDSKSGGGGDLSKEDELVRRMLGKQSNLLRPKGKR